MIRTFQSSPNKDKIRELDSDLVRKEFQHSGKRLRYFGLTSEGLYDVRQWNEFIEHFTAAEKGHGPSPETSQNLLVSRAMQLGLHSKLTLLRGEINDIIIRNQDEVGQSVAYPFELVNLDYGGSLLYPDRTRTTALEVLFNRQRPCDFLLLITSNIREFDPEELTATQQRISQEIVSYRKELASEIADHFKFVNETNSLLRQTTHVHYMMKGLGEANKYKVFCHPAIEYEGRKQTRLLHYAIQLRYQKGVSTRVVSDQNLIDLLNQKAVQLIEGELKPLPHPPIIG